MQKEKKPLHGFLYSKFWSVCLEHKHFISEELIGIFFSAAFMNHDNNRFFTKKMHQIFIFLQHPCLATTKNWIIIIFSLELFR